MGFNSGFKGLNQPVPEGQAGAAVANPELLIPYVFQSNSNNLSLSLSVQPNFVSALLLFLTFGHQNLTHTKCAV